MEDGIGTQQVCFEALPGRMRETLGALQHLPLHHLLHHHRLSTIIEITLYFPPPAINPVSPAYLCGKSMVFTEFGQWQLPGERGLPHYIKKIHACMYMCIQ